MSAVNYKQRFSYGSDILKYFQNYKRYDVDRGHFRKHLQSCTKFMKINDLKMARTISKAFQF